MSEACHVLLDRQHARQSLSTSLGCHYLQCDAVHWQVLIELRCLVYFLFTARCYASAVLAMGLCLSVFVSAHVCHKPVFY